MLLLLIIIAASQRHALDNLSFVFYQMIFFRPCTVSYRYVPFPFASFPSHVPLHMILSINEYREITMYPHQGWILAARIKGVGDVLDNG